MPPKRNFNKREHSPSEKAKRRHNVDLFQEALKISKEIIPIPTVKERIPEEIVLHPQMEIIVEPVNCLDSVINYSYEFPPQIVNREKINRIAMLNMACFSTPGGGVTRGSSAQEEALCRASNLYPSLVETRKFGFYPMKEGFVTQNVTFFRDASGKIIHPSKRIQCDIINLAALKFRHPKAPEDLTQKEKNIMYNKIREMLYLGQGYDCLILSAFGCGAYNNPPELVAEMFYQLLVTEEWGYRFQKVVFAIINDRNGQSNFEIFHNQFHQVN